jgi:hypothetical protein
VVVGAVVDECWTPDFLSCSPDGACETFDPVYGVYVYPYPVYEVVDGVYEVVDGEV